MRFELMAFLYGGPDQLMPLTSGLAAVVALLLIFWNKVLVTFGKMLNFFKPSVSGPEGPSEPPSAKD